MADTAAPALPFEIASQYSTRPSTQVLPTTLDAAAPTQLGPMQIPAVGYLEKLVLRVRATISGGTTPQLNGLDSPFNIIQSLVLRNAAGVNLIAPVKGIDLYFMNKYGGNSGFGKIADPKVGLNYAGDPDDGELEFFITVPIGIDAATAYGAIPALASNANYQLEMILAAQGTVTTSNPTITVQIDATAHYWELPVGTDPTGVAQSTVPPGAATSIWQKENITVSPGTQLSQSYNVGNVIRNHILVLRNASGARIDVNGWPALLELYVDNDPRFSLSKAEHEWLMTRWFGLDAATKDVAGGLDTGVYVLPYHALLGSQSGDPANTRAQLLPTLNATLLQFRAQDYGSAASKLEVLTQSISTQDPAYLFGK